MKLFPRRIFLQGLAGLFLSFLLSHRVQGAAGDPPALPRGRSISESFKGEELSYEIGFWLFKRVALGRLSFRETDKKGQYQALLETETLGVLGFVSRYRVDTYRSVMEEMEEGSRLRSISFEENVKVGNKVRKRVTRFDYPRRKWTTLRSRKDGSLEATEEEIPPGKIYDDFLTAAYNFRYGVYGPIERGKRFIIPTFPRKGATSYEVRVASREEEEKRRRSEAGRDRKEYFVRLILDPEITHSKEGRIEGWLSKDLLPVEGTLKDVLLFGDVKGTLVKSNSQQGENGRKGRQA